MKYINYLIFIIILITWGFAMYFGTLPGIEGTVTLKSGYIIGFFLLLLGINGLWLQNTHLFHHYVFRFMAYSGIIIFLLSICYSILLDLFRQLKILN